MQRLELQREVILLRNEIENLQKSYNQLSDIVKGGFWSLFKNWKTFKTVFELLGKGFPKY